MIKSIFFLVFFPIKLIVLFIIINIFFFQFKKSDFVTSHKIPENVAKPQDDEADDDSVEQVKLTKNYVQKTQKLDTKIQDISRIDLDLDPLIIDNSEGINTNVKRQARVELENFSDAGVIKEEGIRKIDAFRAKENSKKEDVILGVQVR